KRAAGHGMTVGAQHEVPRADESSLDHDLVADAVTDLEHSRAVTRGELANPPMERHRLRRVRRRVMVERKIDARCVEQGVAAHLLEVVDRHRPRTVCAQYQIYAADHDLSRARRAATVRRQDLFTDGLSGHHLPGLTAAAGVAAGSVSPSPRATTTAPTRLL